MLVPMDIWSLADLATPWAIHVAVTLRLAHHLSSGPLPIDSLAHAASADPDALARLLRHLIAVGIFAEPTPGTFALNDAAQPLLESAATLGLNLDSIGGRMANSWSSLLDAVRTGQSPYAKVHGRTLWEDLDAHPTIAADFDALLGTAGHGPADPDVLLDPSEWPQIQTIVDVGGGTGAQLRAVLDAQPHTHGTLVDLPRPLAYAQQYEPHPRMSYSPQSFFDPLPQHADLYLLKSVLCDWPDAEATRILTRCAEAAGPQSRIVLVNGVSPNPTASADLLMLVLVGGKERTLYEFNTLAAAAGLTIERSGTSRRGKFYVQCRATHFSLQ